jgi:hypothetical protein
MKLMQYNRLLYPIKQLYLFHSGYNEMNLIIYNNRFNPKNVG